ncbi:hypothetical protein [Acrocarpospora corrugata]|uniref:hypothetical protein n=1 Tax=Acrocarpospora corrugata TaxID=35763 RepID=UPI0012D2EFC5|nr:hypothetical protein [Acrocarpospora corrugata]
MRQLKYFAGTVLVLAVLGVAAGFAWSALAPRTRYVRVEADWLVADPNTQTLIAADGWFALVCGAFGLVCGLVAYRFAGERAIASVAGLAAGGIVAGLVAYQIGSSMGGEIVQAATAGQLDSQDRLGLTAFGVLMFWPVLAAGAFWALEFAITYRERRAE